jgi:hypothetical protein
MVGRLYYTECEEIRHAFALDDPAKALDKREKISDNELEYMFYVFPVFWAEEERMEKTPNGMAE